MTDSLFSVKDLVVLVSGGSRGIGKTLAKGLAERGARVFIASRDEATLKQAASEISTSDNSVEWIICDVADPVQISKMVDTVVQKAGRIDSLINVAGINVRKRVEQYTVEEFDKILNVNMKGAFLVAQEVGKRMIAQGKGGTIVNIDSLNSHRPLKGVQPYAMSKAAVSSMTRGMAMEWGEHGIRVNAIAPGFILTDLTRKLWSEPTMQAWNNANCPMKRLGETEDLIGTAVFLVSDATKFLTGQIIYVDGGLTCGIHWPIPLT
jgi:NAD(P)-dependent dehydrogenase (short-subunit alcohol dehydrogenase family)